MTRVDHIVQLVQNVTTKYAEVDTRPQWLKDLPGAVHPGEPYYLFLYLLASGAPYHRGGMPEKFASLEIGTRGGTSALHLAMGARQFGYTVTVDVDPGCAPNVEKIAAEHGLAHFVKAITEDSTSFSTSEEFDVLFIDGDHTYASAHGDYLRFKGAVRSGGLILFDDTQLNEGMTQAWNEITEPKIEFPELHYKGFGIAFVGG